MARPVTTELPSRTRGRPHGGSCRGASGLLGACTTAAARERCLRAPEDTLELPRRAPARDRTCRALLFDLFDFADALRANSTLTSLILESCDVWQDAAAAALLLGALTAHRSLRTLVLGADRILGEEQQAPAVAAALGALVAADAPALQELDISHSGLGDACLGALVDALPLNTHLRTLNLDYTNYTKDFAHDRLLPAVRANTSLRHLTAAVWRDEFEAAADDDGEDRHEFTGDELARCEARYDAEAVVDERRDAAP